MAGADVAPVPFGDRVEGLGVSHVVGAFGAECGVGGGVDAGFGEDVAPVAEGVSPVPEAEGRVLGEAAEAPAGPHEGADVPVDGCRLNVLPIGDGVVGASACLTRSLRDVLGHVRGHCVIVGSVAVRAQRPGVDLGTPVESQFSRGRAVGGADQDPPGGGAYRVDEQFCCAPGRGLVFRAVGSVEAYDSVDVDGRPFLVFGDASKGQSGVLGEAGLYEADCGSQAPADVDDEAVPQLGGVCVPQDVSGVVVAVGAQWLADARGVRGMDGAAPEGPPVLAGSADAAGTAVFPGPVDGAEGRGGQGDEEPGPMADCLGDVLAAQQARADEVEGVPGVETGAGGADVRPAVAAADKETFPRFGAGVVVLEDLAGCAVQGGGGAGEVDGVGAPARCADLLQPARELRILGDT